MRAAEAGGDSGRGFAAVDVYYPASGGARAALVLASDRAFGGIVARRTAVVPVAAPYVPGRFFERELPPLRAVLAGVSGIELLVIDGYVNLDPAGRPGLGAHVHAEFGVPVVGVAKTAFAAASHAVPVLRGQATRPLYVTAAGIPLADAAGLVRQMSGRFRLPDALRLVDALSRGRAKTLSGVVSDHMGALTTPNLFLVRTDGAGETLVPLPGGDRSGLRPGGGGGQAVVRR